MSAGRICPNKNRKRPSKGGGEPGCRGHLQAVMLVAVVTPFKSWPKGRLYHGLDTAVSARVARSGVRVSPGQLAEAIGSSLTFDVRCDSCGFSERRRMAWVRKVVTKRRRAA